MRAKEKQAVPLSLVTRDCKDKRQGINNSNRTQNKRQITNKQQLQQTTATTTKHTHKQHLFLLVAQNGPVAEVVDTHWTQGHLSDEAPNPSTMNPNNVFFQWLVTASLRQIPIEMYRNCPYSGPQCSCSIRKPIDWNTHPFLGWIESPELFADSFNW